MRRCSARAPGKVILSGEHWVVHGGRALAAAVGLYARATCTGWSGDRVVVETPLGRAAVASDGTVDGDAKAAPLGHAIRAALELGYRFMPSICSVDSEIPVGAGLGSSAATAVAVAAAYMAYAAGGPPERESVNRAAFEAEKVTHGKPSGVDNTVSTYGGFILYRRGSRPEPLNMPRLDAEVLIALSGVERRTAEAVGRFTRRLEELNNIGIGGSLASLADKITSLMLEAIARGDAATLGTLLRVSHGILNAMGVSHERLEEIVHIAERAGALGAKLTGAGMGGAAIVLCRGDGCAAVLHSLQSRGYRVLQTALGVDGVEITCEQS
ncbi:MAG: mevalonate kinase [Crenarchaeota archaeon]|nr:mevalonate kinase [Thermoproteota archaeon]